MCGIAGRLAFGMVSEREAVAVGRIVRAMRHRGPDSQSRYFGTHAALAGCRLSIIDVEGGGQPLTNETQSIVLFANGEIYNFRELRDLLVGKGHVFRTGSDCECIVHLYEDYGDRCVEHLRGMFAFVLWDITRSRAIVVRDRLGEKPLYVVEDEQGLYFSSELRPMVAAGVAEPVVSLDAVAEYFHFGYVPEPRSALRNVRKLPAGAMICFDARAGVAEEQRYWGIEDAAPVSEPPARAIRSQLEEIGERVVGADVPVGVSLSGGMDSSIVAALAAKFAREPVHAFSLGYEGAPHTDERADAKWLARRLGLVFHDIELTAEDAASRYEGAVARCDDPIADGAAIAFDAIAAAAREAGVPVVLGGQGGDELFLRYRWCRDALRVTASRLDATSGTGLSVARYLRPQLPPVSYVGGMRWLADAAGLRTLLSCWKDSCQGSRGRVACYEFTEPFRETRRVRRKYFGPALESVDVEDAIHRVHSKMRPGVCADVAVMACAIDGYLRENGIAQGDRLFMANSVELRLPLVDYRLVETVAGLRLASGVPTTGDGWLRAAVKDLLPQEVFSRPKRGFSTPWRKWAKEISRRFGYLLEGGALVDCGVLRADAARVLARGVSRLGLPVDGAREALCLEVWLRNVISLSKTRDEGRQSDEGDLLKEMQRGMPTGGEQSPGALPVTQAS